jgi:hypothetical protein
MVKCSIILEEHTGSIFRVTECVQVNAQVRWRKNCIVYVGLFESVRLITATECGKRAQDCSEPMGVQGFQQQPFFPDVTSGRYANSVDIDCGVIWPAVKLRIA